MSFCLKLQNLLMMSSEDFLYMLFPPPEIPTASILLQLAKSSFALISSKISQLPDDGIPLRSANLLA